MYKFIQLALFVEIFRSNVTTLADLLPLNVMAQMEAIGRIEHYRDAELIQRRGDTQSGISILKAGQVIAGNVGMDGSFVVSSVLQPGECFGEFTLFAGLPRTHDLSTSGSAEVLGISQRPFLALFEREPAIAKALLAITLRRTHDLLEFLDAQRRLSLPVRLAKLLLSFLSSAGGSLEVRCKQEELAYMLGVTRVSVHRALKSLVDEGFLSLGYGVIEITDENQLRQWMEARSLIVPVTALVLDRKA